jgi:4-amino-4-deoxy-L-arabinose transferase-like glycosyltransferase
VYALIIAAIGLVLRLLWISAQKLSHTGDGMYERLAMNLLEGHGFSVMDHFPFTPTNIRPPMYPLWIAFIYLLFGRNLMALFYSQALMGALTSVIVYWIGKEIHSEKLGLLAAFLFAIHPYPQLYVTSLFVEVLYSFFVAVTVFFLCRAWKHYDRFQNWILAGISSGIASLLRSEFFLFPLFLISLMIVTGTYRNRLKGGFILMVSVFLTLSPWMVRNYLHFKKIIPTSDSLYGVMFMVTTLDETEFNQKFFPSNPEAHPPSYAISYPAAIEIFKIQGNGEHYNRAGELLAYNRETLRIGINNVRKNPFNYLYKRVKEFPYFWFESGNYILQFIDKKIPGTSWKSLLKNPDPWILFWKFFGMLVTSLLPFGLALLGIWRYRLRGRDLVPLFSILLFVTLIHLPFWYEVRYSVSLYPIVFLFTAMGILKS